MFWRPIPIALIVREQGKMFCVHVKKRDGAAALFAVTDIHDEKEATDKFRMEPYSYDDLSKGHVIRYGDLFVSTEEATVGDKSQGIPHTLVATTNRDKAKRVFPKQTAQGLALTDENGHLLTCDGRSLTFQKVSAGGRRLVESDTPGIFAQDFATWRSPDRILEGHKRLVMAAKLGGKRYSIGIVNGKLAVDGCPHFWTVETGDAATTASAGVRLCLDSRYLTRTGRDLGLTASAAEATRFDFIIPREGQGFNVRVAGTGLVITFKADSQTPVLAPAQENPDERIAQRFLRETPYALLFSANNNEARAMAHDGSRVFAPLFGSGNVHNYLWLWDGDQIMAYDSWRPLIRQKGNPVKLELAPTPGFGTRWHVTPPGNIVTADDPAMSVVHSDYYSNEDGKIFLREFNTYDSQQWRLRPYRETPLSTDMFLSAIRADEKFVLSHYHGRGLLTAPPVGSSDSIQVETWVAAPSPSQVWTHRDGVLVTDGERALTIVDGEPQVSNSQDAHRHKWNLSRDGILSDKSSGEKVLTSGLQHYNPNAVFIKKHDPLNYYDHRWMFVPVKSLRPASSQVILPTKVAGLALSMPAYFSSLLCL